MKLPGTVWALGFVSLFMDLSSELVHALLPLFLTGVLGASMVAVGVVEGIAEATAQIVKLFSGALSDRLGRRKPLVLAGYGLAALSKPLFPLAGSVALVLGARFMDRVGKGIRGSPRDALIADVTPAAQRGAAYGLRQALDTVGAILGPLAAIALMIVLVNDIRAALWLAVVPAVVAVAVLVVFVKEPPAQQRSAARSPLAIDSLRKLSARYWFVVGIGAVLTLARFSEAFLVLRAQDLGLALAWTPVVLVVMNLVYTASAYPAGLAADRGHQNALIVWGLAALIASDLALASSSTPLLFAGVALWGLHMGLTQGLLSMLVAETAPAELRGTAFGGFYLVSGVALLAASVIAGGLWSALGAAATFYAGAAFTAIALASFLALRLSRRMGT